MNEYKFASYHLVTFTRGVYGQGFRKCLLILHLKKKSVLIKKFVAPIDTDLSNMFVVLEFVTNLTPLN